MTAPMLYLIGCASPRSRRLPELVRVLQKAGWDVCVLATPSAVAGGFVDVDELAAMTGRPVRSQYKRLGEEDVLPPADAIVVCPATVNTMVKWALGICDTLVLGLVTEAVGRRIPLVCAPALNSAQAVHPAVDRSIVELRRMGVTVLYGPGVYEPAEPGSGRRDYNWQLILNALPVMS